MHLAPGSLELLPRVADDLGLRSVILVVDPGLAATPWPRRARRLLDDGGVASELFDSVEANPRTTTAEAIADRLRDGRYGGVVGLGGGSVLDAAKASAMLATNPGPAGDFVGKNRYEARPLPFVAIPTTCGTGSEVTWVSVLSDQDAGTKISLKGESMFPAVALVDAELIRTLPGELVASTGLDALTHALEATTGAARNPVSDALAEKAMALLFRYLPRAAADIAGDEEAREAVMRASTLAGLAFGNADVAAVHCLSEAIGGLFDVPHGLANATLLVAVMRAHGESVATRLGELDRLLFAGGDGARHFLGELATLVERLEIPSFAAFGIDPTEHPQIAELAVVNGSNGSNPRPMGAGHYLEILSAVSDDPP